MNFITFFLMLFILVSCEHRAENVEIIYKSTKVSGYKATNSKSKTTKIVETKSIKAPQYSEAKQTIPKKSLPEQTSPKYHTVVKGENYYSIARLYNVSHKDLMNWNNKTNSSLFVGEKLKIFGEEKVKQDEHQQPIVIVANASKPLVVKTTNGGVKQHSYNSSSKCKNKFIPPILSKKLLIEFNQLQSGGIRSDGIVFDVSLEEPVKVAQDGEVVYVGDQISDYGNVIIVKHDQSFFSIYGYLKNINTQKGAKLKQGEIISYTSTKEGKLYFAIRKGKTPTKPIFC